MQTPRTHAHTSGKHVQNGEHTLKQTFTLLAVFLWRDAQSARKAAEEEEGRGPGLLLCGGQAGSGHNGRPWVHAWQGRGPKPGAAATQQKEEVPAGTAATKCAGKAPGWTPTGRAGRERGGSHPLGHQNPKPQQKRRPHVWCGHAHAPRAPALTPERGQNHQHQNHQRSLMEQPNGCHSEDCELHRPGPRWGLQSLGPVGTGGCDFSAPVWGKQLCESHGYDDRLAVRAKAPVPSYPVTDQPNADVRWGRPPSRAP